MKLLKELSLRKLQTLGSSLIGKFFSKDDGMSFYA